MPKMGNTLNTIINFVVIRYVARFKIYPTEIISAPSISEFLFWKQGGKVWPEAGREHQLRGCVC